MKVEYNIYFDQNGKLNDKGKSLYVEAILLKRQTELPAKIQTFVAENPSYQSEILDIYQMMKDENIKSLKLNPYWKKQSKSTKIRQIISGKNIKVVVVIAFLMLFSIGYLSWQNEFRVQTAKGASKSKANITSYSIQSPFKDIDTPFEKWEIDSEKARTIYLKNGTEIDIPANAFVNEKGKRVSGKIDLYYREFHTAGQIIASGIPMTYDSAGVQHHFESAGMFEIRGKQHGRNIEVALNKPLEVRMRSYIENDNKNFNHYYLQESQPKKELVLASPLMNNAYAQNEIKESDKPKWQYLGKSKVVQGIQKIVKQEEEANDLLEEVEITETEEQIPDLCKIRFDTKNYPELNEYAQTTWQFVDKIGNANKYNPNSLENRNLMQQTFWEYASLTQPEYISFSLPNKKAVRDARFSKDGKYILTASENGVARLWTFDEEKITFRVKTELVGHHRAINLLKFSPDENTILTVSVDKNAILWDKKGSILQRFEGHTDAITDACFSPNGQYILTASDDKTAKLWKIDGTVVKTFKDFKEKVSQVSFSPNGKKILISSYDWTAKLYNLKGKKIADLNGHKSWVNIAKFSPNGQYILTASPDQTVKIWNPNGKLIRTFPKQYATINSAIFSKNSQEVLISTGNLWNKNGKSEVKLFDIKGNLKQKFPSKSMASNAQFSHNEDKIIIAQANSLSIIYSKKGKKEGILQGKDWKHNTTIQKVAFSPNDKFMLTFAEKDQNAKVWLKTNLAADEYVLQLKDKGSNTAKIFNKATLEFKEIKRKHHKGEISAEEFRRAERRYEPIKNKYLSRTKYFIGFVKKYQENIDSGLVQDYTKTRNNNQKFLKRLSLRGFSVANMGVYNIDTILERRQWLRINAQLKIPQRFQNKIQNSYQAVNRNNRIAIISNPNFLDNRVNIFSQNMYVFVFSNNYIGIVKDKQFKKLDIEKIKKSIANTRSQSNYVRNYPAPKCNFDVKIYKLKNMEGLEKILTMK